jgi:hypothetical protein
MFWLEYEISFTGSCIEPLVPSYGAILGVGGNFRRWALVRK